MKKSYCFLSILLTGSICLIGQNQLFPKMEEAIPLPQIQTGSEFAQKIKAKNSKAPGDTLYYEDFAGGIPTGWSTINFSGGPISWQWSTAGPSGQYSSMVGSLPSTSSSNGFMLLDIDGFYTPTPPTGFIPITVSITSPAISINSAPSVILKLEQNVRYCCINNGNAIEIEVSNDGTSWTSFDAVSGRPPSTTASTNPEILSINVSNVLANSTTAYFRFSVDQLQSYYWMLDDLLLEEGTGGGFGSPLEVTESSLKHVDTATFSPVYTIFPTNLINSFGATASIANSGTYTQTGVQVKSEMIMDSLLTGGIGAGVVYTQIDSSLASLPSGQSSTFDFSSNPYLANQTGYFRSRVSVSSDSVSQSSTFTVRDFKFEVRDTIWARDRGVFNGNAATGNFIGGDNIGDRWAVAYHTNMVTFPFSLNAIKIYVRNVSSNIGAQVIAKVWTVDLSGGIAMTEVGTSANARTITSSDLGTWIKIPLSSPFFFGSNQQLAFGWEQANGNDLIVGSDLSMGSYVPALTNFIYINDATPTWGWTNRVAGVRGVLDFSVSVSEHKKVGDYFSIFPNPTKDQLKVQFNGNVSQLKLINQFGQTVLERNVIQSNQELLDVDGLEAGIYFVVLESDNRRKVRKVIIQ